MIVKKAHIPGLLIGVGIGGVIGTGVQFARGLQKPTEAESPTNSALVNMISSVAGVVLDSPMSTGFGAGYFISSLPHTKNQ